MSIIPTIEQEMQGEFDVLMNTHQPSEESMTLREAFEQASNLNKLSIYVSEIEMKTSKIDHEKYRPYFLHVPVEKIKKTLKVTTQFAGSVISGTNI